MNERAMGEARDEVAGTGPAPPIESDPGPAPPPASWAELTASISRGRLPAVDASSGPYLFCDYWASVFGLHGVVSDSLIARGALCLEHFRKAIDRPRTRLPKLRYYILAFVLLPALFPYKVVYDIMRLLRGRAEKMEHPVDLLMGRYRLRLDPADEGRVRATVGDATVAEELIDPGRVGVEVSLFYPTYKLLLAGICSVILSMGVLPLLWRIDLVEPLQAHFEIILVSLMFLTLLVLFRDLLTAILAPLPILAVRYLMRAPDSAGGLLLASLGFILLYFLVEWFFLPRSLPPSLFLYVNDPESEHFPYEKRHAPYWLDGRCYWVWRFVVYAPAELTKFWEKDWERVEVWVRADGEDAGKLEWVVYDCHYRELWFSYERLTRTDRRTPMDWRLARGLEENRRYLWILETDMDLLFHAPFVRGIFLANVDKLGPWGSVKRLLRALQIRPRPDRYERYERRLADLEIRGAEFLTDVPEHVRGLALRAIVRMPWSYWRYPLGAATAPRRFVYEEPGRAMTPAPPAADPRYQIKHLARKPGDAWQSSGDAHVSQGREG